MLLALLPVVSQSVVFIVAKFSEMLQLIFIIPWSPEPDSNGRTKCSPEVRQQLVHELDVPGGARVGDVLPPLGDHEVPGPQEPGLVVLVLGVSLPFGVARDHRTRLPRALRHLLGGALDPVHHAPLYALHTSR